MNRFDSINVGDKAEIKHVVTQRDIEKFIELTGDDNKLHYDIEYAEKTSFKKPVVHGMLGASFISTIIGTKLPGDGALWFSQTLEFLLPVRVGDELTVKAEVVKKINKIHAIELTTEIFNQYKQKVTSGLAQVKIVEQETETPAISSDKIERKKVALVLGATGGIGIATCKLLAEEGYEIAIHYHSNQKLAEQLRLEIENVSGKSHIYQCDISDKNRLEELIFNVKRRFGDISAVINCATIKIPSIKFEDLDWQDIQNQLDINIKANFDIVKAVAPLMEQAGYGKFVFISTQYTESTPPPYLLPYVTAKYALNGFVKALAVELANKGLQVNLVSPGMTETNLISDIPERIRLVTAANSPIQRLANPDDIAGAISFLISKKSNYITGETIRVNGGQVML